ncbi:xanthine dehydrogenase family protein molybdopterin-binding subunit [Streptomyces viridochromogenes]|uniref:Putative Xanthine dehydrogenase, molybdenum binding subunit apoprotein n=1 Tax=Streptomyces viridochromogenes Tue57 TaxID=1160705 RepID=L8P4F1_STRVR|nr:xanthine dehydrogenase family protein molybdopterin-binding subunit [Streptomyces viridochromogenes]ELS51059.1 putative Xanthine dehydrogenase, molybdenum binding subunit apoprotein [Streptomyces viridochromogenes Tue57]
MIDPTALEAATGRATYLGDVVVPGTAHVALVRSSHPHARILRVDSTSARRMPGVVGVVTAAELAGVGPVPHNVDPVSLGGQHMDVPVLPADTVLYTGQPVAAVVAETPGDALAAAAAVDVAYEPLPFVLTPEEALADDAPLLVPGWRDNVIASGEFTDGDPDAAFASAEHVIEAEVAIQRATTAPMETRGYLADWDVRGRRLILWATSQNPHQLRGAVAASLGLAEHQVRVVAPRAGGSFGLKMHGYPEEILVCALARLLGRPVRWVEDRAECLLVGSREHTASLRAGANADGRLMALDVTVTGNLGAPAALPGWGQTFTASATFPGGYRLRDCRIRWRAVATNKAPWNGARGYGKELTALALERVMDRIAEVVNLDPAEVRRRNWVRVAEFPYDTATGLRLDSGDYHGLLERALKAADFDAQRVAQRQAREQGRLIGIGLGFEVVPESPDLPGSLVSGADTATVRMTPDGHVTVLTGVTSPGGGSDRGIARLVAAELGIDPAEIIVLQGDTDLCPYGYGNLGSRSLVAGGGAAVLAARDIAAKLRTVAANMLHTEADAVVLGGGTATAGDDLDRSVPLAAVAHAVHSLGFVLALGIDPALEATRTYRPGHIRHLPDAKGHIQPFATYSSALHVSVVELLPDTGELVPVRHVVAHDCGTVVDTGRVEGQLHGAVAMGMGLVLGEELAYAEDGHPRAAGFKTYLMPRATDVPPIEVVHQQTPSPFTFNGTKGAGETGVGGTVAALVNAVNDAVRPWGVRFGRLPLTPPNVLAALQRSEQSREAVVS